MLFMLLLLSIFPLSFFIPVGKHTRVTSPKGAKTRFFFEYLAASAAKYPKKEAGIA